MKETKIQLSPAEVDLMCNAEMILTKNKIILTIKEMMEDLQNEMISYTQANNHMGNGLFLIHPKISKGENYLGLPYLVLDYPRIFSKSETFAIRNMFWWGNFFSTTLHLSGNYKEKYLGNIERAYEQFVALRFYLSINTDEWAHHFEDTNYRKIETLTKEQFTSFLRQLPHIKIAAKCPLNEWQSAANTLLKNWKFLLEVCLA